MFVAFLATLNSYKNFGCVEEEKLSPLKFPDVGATAVKV